MAAVRIAWSGENPACRASTPKDIDSTNPTTAYGMPSRPGREGVLHGLNVGDGVDRESGGTSTRSLKREEHRLPVLRPLDRLAAVADAVGVGRAAAVDRARGRGRGGGRGRRLLPRPPLRAPARLAVPAAGRRRRAHQPDRARHGRHRHALREPALHGRGRRRRRPDRRRPAPARHQPGLTGAGRRGLPLLRARARRGHRPRRHGPRARAHLPRGARGEGVRRAQPATDVPQPARAAPHRAALARAARPHLVGRRHPQDGGVDRRAGHEPDELHPAHRGHRRAVPPAPGRADPDVPRRLDRRPATSASRASR